MNRMFTRSLRLPAPGKETFFLWGPRQTGKTTLLLDAYPDAFWVDLLKADEFRKYATRPERLREELQAGPVPSQVVIDEIQKVPALLDEVHWLHERLGLQFALCGSSARKVRRGGANLLGGRALRYELHGLTAGEIGKEFELARMLNHGWLPRVYVSDDPGRLLESYVADYLKEEIAAEGLVRNLPVFSHFLEAAALSDGGIVNFANIARECGVSGHTVKAYFEILEDTRIARWLPAYTRRPKRRVIAAPKLYFTDVGIVNHLARRGTMAPGSELFGQAFESWVFHELITHVAYHSGPRSARLSYWRLAGGTEVDFVIDDARAAIEAKASRHITADHLKGLRAIRVDHPKVERFLICLEPRRRITEDKILILPANEFPAELARGRLLS
jgi:predicted AAA+ superfamily ATPase